MLLASGFSEEDVAVQQAFGAYPVGAKDSDGSEVLRPEAKAPLLAGQASAWRRCHAVDTP